MNNARHIESSYYRSLTRKMISIIIIVSFMPMVLIGGIILSQFDKSYHEKTYAHLGTLVQQHKQNIDTFLNEKLSDIRFFATNFSFEKLSDKFFLQQTLFRLQQEYGSVFVDMGLVDEDGLMITYAGPFKLEEAKYSEAEWFKKAIKKHYFISDVFLGLRGLPHFIITVKQYYEKKPYILRATIDFVAFNNFVENVRIGETGFAFILNRKGEFQTNLPLNIIPDKGLYMAFIKKAEEERARKGVQIVEKHNGFGKKRIYVADFLKNGEWLLVFQQDTAEVFAELHKAMYIAVFIILIGGLGIIIMAFFQSRRMVCRIAEADKEKEMMNQQVIETGKLASIGELASGIAHEINNPVAIMVEEAGWIQDLLAEEEFQKSDNLNEFEIATKQIQIQGQRCKEITNKLLSFARKTDARVSDVQINDLVNELVELSSQRAKYSNVTIKTDLQKDLPLIKISESEMQQVFFNLINNAIDAINRKDGIIDIYTQLQDDNIIITVSDNGSGIPRDNLARIFDPFFTTKPVGKGTGLGLSICYGIIKKLGGEIDVKSVLDMGTVFTIRIPVFANK
ncbi:MAG: ATP-binding protein [Desulfobacterales bacterium]|nr:ATP-binding protein [Desulfobacterales bacterium]